MVGMPDPNEFSPARWPVVRQMQNLDAFGLSDSAVSARTESLAARTAKADKVLRPFAPTARSAAGSSSTSRTRRSSTSKAIPRSPISNGCLCPEGRGDVPTGHGLASRAARAVSPAARDEWETIPLEQAMDMVAERVKKTRDETLGRQGRRGRAAAAHHGDRAPGRRHARQRRELPDQEAVHRARHRSDRKSGPYLTLLHGPQSGDLVRTEAAPPRSSRICRTRTASSSKARIWRSAIRSASAG